MAKPNKKPQVNKPFTKGNAKFIQLNKEFIAPITRVENNVDFIKYGDKNDYPELLVSLLATSGLHRAIIEKKVQMCMGSGINLEVDQKTLDFIMHPNPYEDLNSLMEKCSYDLETFGGYYLQVIWEPNKKEIAEIYHMDFERMRVGNPNGYGFVGNIYYFDDLTLNVSEQDLNAAIEFEVFSNTADKSEPQILQAKKYAKTNKYYGAPIYEASVLDIQTYGEIANYHNSNLHNNFSPGYMIFFQGTPPSEELQADILRELQIKYAGSENTGAPMVFFLEEEMAEPIVKPVEASDLDKQFEQLIQQLISNIAISHQIPRQVVGIETTGSLGSSKELLQATELFRASYIEPQQQTLLSTFNALGLINGFDEIKINNPNPSIMMFDLKELLMILSKNELREWLGFETEELDDTDVSDEKNNEIEDEQ